MSRQNQGAFVIDAGIAAAGADAAISGGLLSLPGCPPIVAKTLQSARKDVYNAGTPSVKAFTAPAATQGTYTLEIDTGIRQDPSEFQSRREYNVTVPEGGLTGAQLAAAIKEQIDADNAAVVSCAVSTATVTLTLLDVASGDFYLKLLKDLVDTEVNITITTPFAEAVGTVTEVEGATGVDIVGTDYTRYVLNYHDQKSHQGVQGGLVNFPREFTVYINEDATNAAALITAIDAVIAGTAPGILGVPVN